MLAIASRLSFQITGTPEDNGDVRFDEFIKQLEKIKFALSETRRIVAEDDTVYYRVVDLQHASPALITVEAVGNSAPKVMDTLYSGVRDIQDHQTAPPDFDYFALMAIRSLTDLLGKSVSNITIRRNGDAVPLTTKLLSSVDAILGPDLYEFGSYTGMLHQVNLHGRRKVFTIYSTWKAAKLRCVFPEGDTELRKKVAQGVDRYVEVYGRFKYKQNYDDPYEIEAKDIVVFPEEDQLPKLWNLRGIAPDATGGKPSEEFIGEIRQEWD